MQNTNSVLQSTVISDLFGNKLKNNSNYNQLPFIMIHSYQPYLILNKFDNTNIFKLNKPIIKDILTHNGFDHTLFAPMGDYKLSNKLNSFSIILVNTANSDFPDDFIPNGKINQYTIWKPVTYNGSIDTISNVLSIRKPSLDIIRLPGKKYLKQKQNNHHYLITDNDNYMSIDKTTTLQSSRKLKFVSRNNRAITNHDSFVKLKPNNNNYDSTQHVTYTVQGEIKMSDQCLTTDGSSDVYLRDCDNDDMQKWYPWQDKIKSNDSNKCLTDDNGKLSIYSCNNSSNQSWKTYHIDKDKKWNNVHGTYVTLVESNEPWYIRSNNKPIGVMRKINLKSYDDQYISNANFKTDTNLDHSKGDLGFGHSYASRKNKIIEGFTQNKKKYYMFFICLLLILFFIFFLRKRFNN